MDNRFSLEKKMVAITGALGRLGVGVVKSCLKAEAEVLLLDIKDQRLSEIESRIGNTTRVHYENFDITKHEEISSKIDIFEKNFGSIDVWVNSAYPRTPDWISRKRNNNIETWRKNIDLHLNSYCICSGEIAKKMAERKRGVIINVSSIYGIVAPDFSIYEGTDKYCPSAYSAIKAGIIMHSKWLASFYGKRGIRVNVVCAGAVFSNQSDPFLGNYSRRTLLKRMAKPEEIGDPIVFLASDAASYITGAVLVVDGGLTAI